MNKHLLWFVKFSSMLAIPKFARYLEGCALYFYLPSCLAKCSAYNRAQNISEEEMNDK